MQIQARLRMALALALVSIFLAGCGIQASASNPGAASLVGGATNGYLATPPHAALFLQLTANGNSVTGMLSLVHSDNGGIYNVSGPISGTIAGSNLTLWTGYSFLASQFAHATEGSVNGSSMDVSFQSGGSTTLTTLHFHAATVTEYNRITTKLTG